MKKGTDTGEEKLIRTAEETVKADLESIYIGNLNTVDADLILPAEGKYGSHFIWMTGEERFIEANGTVHRPLHGMGNRKVTLTVKASCDTYAEEREFTATVLQEEKETVITEIHKVRLTAICGEKAELPPDVIVNCADGRCMTMPVCWEEYEPLSEEGTVYVKGSVCTNGSVSIKRNISVKGTVCEEENEELYEEGAVAEILFVSSMDMDLEELPKQKGWFFRIRNVRLSEGTLYYEYQQRMLEYLLQTDDDQMLYNFRREAGLDTKGAPPMTGWDEEGCKLKGHTTGHYLSGLALAWGSTGDVRFHEKMNYMIESLYECQEKMAASGKYHRGFLSAYSEEQFDLLEKYTKYPEIWAPYYTLDKIMSGLYDCYEIAGNEKARIILERMGDWVYDRLSRLTKETLNQMWAMYIAGEFGGMLGTMVKLYQISGKESHLKAAKLFLNEKLFYPMEQGIDTLEDMHANQHIPQIMGAMELFGACGERRYWEIGKNFWNIVTGGHIYCNGGTGETEMFHRAGTVCSYLSDKSEESCASYNMLRLTTQIFGYTMDGSMMDYYDNTLRNHILASCSHESDGGTTYFLPLGAGGRKEYSTAENSCCHGTGMESRFRYMEHIYAYDEEYVYVNLLIDSILSGDASLEQRSSVNEGEVRIKCLKTMGKKLKVHIPVWAQQDFTVFVNGVVQEEVNLENGYVCAAGFGKEGDEMLLKLPMELRIMENDSDKELVNLAYGPYLLAALSEEKEFLTVPVLEKMVKIGEKCRFEADGVKYIPLAEVDLEDYHVYFRQGDKRKGMEV